MSDAPQVKSPSTYPFSCPACGAIYRASPKHAGVKFACKNCGQRIETPQPPQNKTVLGTVAAEPSPLPFAEPVDPAYREPGRTGLQPHRGILVLILGIAGFMFWVTAPIAWIIGRIDLKAMNRGEMDPGGRDLTKIGKILGMIVSIFWMLWGSAFVVGGIVVAMRGAL